MASGIIPNDNQFASKRFDAMAITSGFVVCYWDLIRTGANVFFAPTYQGSSNTEAMTYIYTLQPQNGLCVIYVRKGDGTIPADGKVVGGRLYLEVKA